MNKEFYIELIYKSLSGELSDGEKKQLEDWLSAKPEHQKELETIEKMWGMSANFTKDIEVDLDKDFAQLQQKIQTEPQQIVKEAVIRKLPQTENRQNKTSWWKPLSVAAAVLLLAGAFFIFNNSPEQTQMLALETGEEKKEVTLADGSKVWLNENSKLTYPNKMDDARRIVKLEGKAFFDIERNPKKPFIIETNNADVEVLGTSFQVTAYETTKTEVIVKTGKVSLGKKNEVKPLILTANQTGIYDSTTDGYGFGKEDAVNVNELSWHTNVLEFDDIRLEQVLTDLENHFDIELTLTNQDLLNCPYSSIFNAPKQQETLAAVCKVFKLQMIPINDKSFRLDGGKCSN